MFLMQGTQSLQALSSSPSNLYHVLLCGHQFIEKMIQEALKIKIDHLAGSQRIGTKLEAMWALLKISSCLSPKHQNALHVSNPKTSVLAEE